MKTLGKIFRSREGLFVISLIFSFIIMWNVSPIKTDTDIEAHIFGSFFGAILLSIPVTLIVTLFSSIFFGIKDKFK